jgi:hypothetical protein
MIALHPLDEFLMERSEYMAPTLTASTFMLDRTSITNLSISPVRDDLFTSATGVQFQYLALWANVVILIGILLKLVRVIVAGSFTK